MSWAARSRGVKVGDRVCFSRTFLQSTSQVTGPVPFARGTVTDIKEYAAGFAIATIDWGDPDMPERVNVANLSRVTEMGILE